MAKSILMIGLIWLVLVAGLMLLVSVPDYFTSTQKLILMGIIVFIGVLSTVFIIKD